MQTTYGLKNEKNAIAAYEALAHERHNPHFSRSGLIIIPEGRPFLAATPKLLVGCTCCGKGVAEVKCPYKHRGMPLESAANDKTSCATLVDGDLLFEENAWVHLLGATADVCLQRGV